jgi:threonylcarbamoyladenosine tRNA methylthiotransferase MtaB
VRAAFYTLGCKLNQCESESIASSFAQSGWTICPPLTEADLYIVNTCTVTSKSEQKARRIVRRISREYPEALIIVTGCYAQVAADEVARLGDRVFVLPHDRKSLLHDLPDSLSAEGMLQPGPLLASWIKEFVGRVMADESRAVHDPFRYAAGKRIFRTRSFLKIQDGCDNRCAYCRVPLARGNSVSLGAERVIERVRSLGAEGIGEIVLTGVNISNYRDGSRRLADLLALILSLPGNFRIRLSSLEPDRITPDLLEMLGENRICPHFHLPIQSGSDRVLQRMARHYSIQTALSIISELRKKKEDPFIAADMIVGFPGEGDEEFGETMAFLLHADFAYLHIFPYSPRPGTSAYSVRPLVPQRIAEERGTRLQAISDSGHASYVKRWTGREERLLVESSSRGVSGTTGNYLKVTVPGASSPEGSVIPIVITGGDPLTGRLL